MLQKLIIFILSAMLLAGCGASAPDAATVPAGENLLDTTAYRAETLAPVEAAPETTEAYEITTPAPEFFCFERTSSTIENDNGTTILYENYCVADFSSDNKEHAAFVDTVLEKIRRDYTVDSENLATYAGDYLAEFGTEGFYAYSNYQDLGITRCDDKMVSLISLNSLYAGGAHPNSVQVAYNLNLENQRILTLEDIILENGADELAKMVRSGVDEKFAALGEGALFSDYGHTIENSLLYGQMTPYWYCNSQGLVIFYNQYELGPYAAGIIKVELPYTQLSDILNPDYLPQTTGEGDGTLFLRADSENQRRIPVTIDAEGETVLVGVEGQIYQVRLSEVIWLENTPIAQKLLFAAISMDECDILEITGGVSDDSRSFALEFITGQGEERVIYIHKDSLTETP